MNNLNLTSAEFDRLLKAFASVVFLGALGFAFIQSYFFCVDLSSVILRSFSQALGIFAVIFTVFYKVAWRWPLIAKLMQKPIVHGVWIGKLRSDFGGSTDKKLELPIVFVLKQTYLTLSVQSFTASQQGESRLEALIRNVKTEASRLSYVFELRKIFPGANIVTSGAGDLRIESSGKILRGTYWTNTPTHGEIILELISHDCEYITCYEDAKIKWPNLL